MDDDTKPAKAPEGVYGRDLLALQIQAMAPAALPMPTAEQADAMAAEAAWRRARETRTVPFVDEEMNK